ncbi:hypothetical protein HOY80DRAFT_974296 [Tuber brumale]|nr:hypothetical protein HOY80DRAFT_974296 [Tuber brumale]
MGYHMKGCVVQSRKKGLDGRDGWFGPLEGLFEEENHIKDSIFLEDDVFGDSESTKDSDSDDDVDDIC